MSLLPYLFDVQRPFRMMDHDVFGVPDVPNVVPRQLNPNRSINPWGDVFAPMQNIVRPLEQLASVMSQLALTEGTKISSTDEKFQVNIDVQHFSPEEIDVKVINGHVVVEGRHEEKKDEHGYVSRQFVRRYALPAGCLPDTVESTLSSDGVLTVTAPKVLALPSTGEKIIPIKHTGPVKKAIASPEPIQQEE